MLVEQEEILNESQPNKSKSAQRKAGNILLHLHQLCPLVTSIMTSKEAQEGCGVWLDTVKLKGKAKQKRVARPISKLLSPFAKGGGYSLAVALNFTQTKMEMPKTKQSCISTFFAPQRRVLKKMSLSEAPNTDPAQSTSSVELITSGTKRRRDAHQDMPDSYDSAEHQYNNVHEKSSVTETEAVAWWEHSEVSHSPPQNAYREVVEERPDEVNPPERKRRFAESSSAGDSQPVPQAWSQDPLLTWSQDSDNEYETAKDLNDSPPSLPLSFPSEEAFVFQMDVGGKTSTQKSLKHFHSSQMDDEKENSQSSPAFSPQKRPPLSCLGPLSNHKSPKPKMASPLKRVPEQPCKKTGREESRPSGGKWARPSSVPLKRTARQQDSEADEDALALLFTQDSEGFRVIAHRGLQTRSPLKDQSNVGTRTARGSSTYKSLVDEEDEEDEVLFTQDSQGNMVIKH